MNVIYQLWQIWNDNGNEFLMGTYLTKERAETEKEFLLKDYDLNVQYIIKKERVIK